MKYAKADRSFHIIVNALLLLISLCILIPLINIVACSFSDYHATIAGRVGLWPVDFSLDGYKEVFSYKGIGTSYMNTIFYTVAGTFVNIVMTMVAAYSLSKKGVPFRGLVMGLFTFTMLFSGGIIPNYMLYKDLHILNTRLVMILPGAISVYNMFIARTFIQNIPQELWEAADIDGCTEFRFFASIVLPLAVTVITVLSLYYAVGHWNSYFDAFMYLNKQELMPLQVKLREILILNTIDADKLIDSDTASAREGMAEMLKYALIIVSSAPVLCLYPFAKRYFMRGVMLGSLKG